MYEVLFYRYFYSFLLWSLIQQIINSMMIQTRIILSCCSGFNKYKVYDPNQSMNLHLLKQSITQDFLFFFIPYTQTHKTYSNISFCFKVKTYFDPVFLSVYFQLDYKSSCESKSITNK